MSLEEKCKALEMIRKGRPDNEIMSTCKFKGIYYTNIKTELQNLKIVGECHSTESETKNACDERVAMEENSDSRLAILSSLFDEDIDTIE